MSSIVLSSSVRQNLLSLQSTADLLSTTQSRLATGKKVNTALDNPTNYFTASALDSRASDINNLLDGIGNGVQVLQAANTGITSLQKLVDSAKSVANQALQTTVGYSQKSTVTTAAITGASVDNLLGTAGAGTAGTVTAGAFTSINVSGTGASATSASVDAGTLGTVDLSGLNTLAFTIDIDGTSTNVSLSSTITAASTSAVTGAELATAINAAIGGGSTAASFAGGKLTFASSSTGTNSSVAISSVTGTAASASGITAASDTGAAATGADALAFTVTTDGTAKSISISAASVTAYNGAHSGATLNAASLSAADVASLVNYQVDNTGATTVATVAAGALVFTSPTTGASSSIATSAVTGTATAGSTGITAATNTGAAPTGGLSGKTLNIASTGGGTAIAITFGTAAGEVKSLNDLNAKLSSNNLQATLSTDGRLSITTTNDSASSTIGAITGTAQDPGAPFAGLTGPAPTLDPVAQQTRANLVTQYNNIIDQIRTTAQDSSFNGVNLLNGDQLKLTFNETGSSTLNVTGVVFNPAGLGLGSLTSGTDFIDNAATNKVLASLNNASSTLRGQASALGSNLSVVQIRQDFSKNLINVLQTGSSNLTLADTNEEAANSQALSTRQSIAVSALALANQSQQSVLQLLR